jgi:coenzyme F420-reducing hydrogenase beta subunit
VVSLFMTPEEGLPKAFSAKTGIEGQDGGVVTAILLNGFENKVFDAAIVVQRRQGYNAQATVADNAEEVLAAKGTKYVRVNMAEKLKELINQGEKKIAIVCTPCQAEAARKIQQAAKDACEVTIIGLFCFQAFNATRLKEQVKVGLGIDLEKAEKTAIRKGKFIAKVDGKEYSCKVRELDMAVEKSCLYCERFVAEAADVCVGSAGSQDGYSTVILQTTKGNNLIRDLVADKADVDQTEIEKLKQLKQQRARANLAAAKKKP